MPRKVQILNSKVLYDGKWVQLALDEIIKPDGTRATHEVVKRRDGILIIPITNNKYYFVSQYRYPVNEVCLEFPTGFIDDNENHLDTAKRELREEIGGENGTLQYIGFIWSWAGLMTQRLHVYVARDFRVTLQELEASEKDLKVITLSKTELNKKLLEGDIKNSSTLAALTLLNILEK